MLSTVQDTDSLTYTLSLAELVTKVTGTLVPSWLVDADMSTAVRTVTLIDI